MSDAASPSPDLHPPSHRAAYVAIRSLPAAAGVLGLGAVVLGADARAATAGALLIACALLVEACGWARAARLRALRLGAAAVVGAIVVVAGLSWYEMAHRVSEPATSGPLAANARGRASR